MLTVEFGVSPDEHGVPFYHWDGKQYGISVRYYVNDLFDLIGTEYPIAMSGWLKQVKPCKEPGAINIHPGSTKKMGGRRQFAGRGMYGHHVHQAVYEAWRRGEIHHTGVTMHYVTDDYDEGPTIAWFPVKLVEDDTPETIAASVNAMEHKWQSLVTASWLHHKIRLQPDGTVMSPFLP